MAFLPRSLRDRPTPGPSPEASWLSRLGLALGIGVGAVAVGLGPAAAQAPSTLAACEPPGDREYLLLVVVGTDEAQNRLTQTLPPSVKAPTCDYLGSRVARMGGFKTPEDADAWASYLREVASLAAFVAKPSQPGAIAQTPVAPPASATLRLVRSQPPRVPLTPIPLTPIPLT
ncbi:MAG: hypothetical protein HC824_15655 [Synechococcales cyanobacterium RM1_1_8]|nr:hypothetical protein [Synechococcales cyanobacterium RM1_1_8]